MYKWNLAIFFSPTQDQKFTEELAILQCKHTAEMKEVCNFYYFFWLLLLLLLLLVFMYMYVWLLLITLKFHVHVYA